MAKHQEYIITKDQSLMACISRLNSKIINLDKKAIHLLPIGENNYVWIILSGWVLTLRGDSEGHLKGTAVLGEGDIFGISGFAGNTKSAPVYTLNNVSLQRVPIQEFQNLISQNAQLSQFLLQYISGRYLKILDELERSAFWTLEDRIRFFTETISTRKLNASETLVGWAVGAHPASICRSMSKSKDLNTSLKRIQMK